MKFLQNEFQSFQKIIHDNGFATSDFSFVKKRGRLFVHQVNRLDAFCFYRKKETKLNEQLQFEDTVLYFLDSQNKIKVDTWDEVFAAFEKWLKKA